MLGKYEYENLCFKILNSKEFMYKDNLIVEFLDRTTLKRIIE